jgi:predicted TIM-barrel fold metal-dependent hydrolase
VRPPETEVYGGNPFESTGLPEMLTRYNDLFDMESQFETTYDDIVESMDHAGVDRAVMQAEYEPFNESLENLNETVSELVSRDPDRFVGFGAVDLSRRPMESVATVERCYHDLGLRGINIQPWASEVLADDEKCYPVYTKCAELGIPVTIHTGINHGVGHEMKYGRPGPLDQIATDFPDLTIVANHAAWPWTDELVAIAWKHGNVYLELGGVLPHYAFADDTGWTPMRRFADSLLQDRVVFATDWPVLNQAEWLERFDGVGLKDQTRRKLLHDNAQRLLEEVT